MVESAQLMKHAEWNDKTKESVHKLQSIKTKERIKKEKEKAI